MIAAALSINSCVCDADFSRLIEQLMNNAVSSANRADIRPPVALTPRAAYRRLSAAIGPHKRHHLLGDQARRPAESAVRSPSPKTGAGDWSVRRTDDFDGYAGGRGCREISPMAVISRMTPRVSNA